MWRRRHRGVVLLLWAHIPALLVFGVLTHHGVLHTAVDVTPVLVIAVIASRSTFGRTSRSVLATMGLVTCSALLVHFSHGNIEMHFHFFVVVGVISLYQEWAPFCAAIVFVVLHHGIMGALSPASVYDHRSAVEQPWLWAAIHGAFVLAASVPHLLAWRLNEDYALRDALTKLPNRVLFGDRLSQALTRRERYGTSVAVLFVDLDGFKQVNDTLGHARGDQLLAAVAGRLTSVLRAADTAGRFGGDEFGVILEGDGAMSPEQTAHRLLRALREPVELGGRPVFASASVGIAVARGHISADDLVRNADLAMYLAKASGRGRCEVFDDSMHVRALEAGELVDDLRIALENNSLFVEYQPTVELRTGRLLGVEALARWDDPRRGRISPVVFIPAAERADLIGRLGLFVLEEACKTIRALHEASPYLDLSVNISPNQLHDPGFPASVTEVLDRTGFDPRRLVLEITEGVLIHDVELVIARLNELKALGVRIAVDDFGTGFSSLSYLRQFSIDILKIDQSFVATLPADGSELAQTILRLGEMLELGVVAEGIETDAQLAKLSALGCVYGQGFLFARPLAPSELRGLVASGGHLTAGVPTGTPAVPAAS